MKLRDYLLAEKLPAAAFARRIGVSQAAVARYASGDRTPEPKVMRRIAHVTAGVVTPNDFYDMPASPKRQRGNQPVALAAGLMEEAHEWQADIGKPAARSGAKAKQRRKKNREAVAEANSELARHGLGSDGLDSERHRKRRRAVNRVAIKAWNEWIEENGIPFAELRPW